MKVNFDSEDGQTTSLLINRDKFVQTSDQFKNLVALSEVVSPMRPTVLTFTEDGHALWNWLLYWITTGEFGCTGTKLPKSNDIPRLVSCWLLGNSYDVPDFQDCAMIYLLRYYDNDYSKKVGLNNDQIEEAFDNTVRDSPLRVLIAEEIIKEQRREGRKIIGSTRQYDSISEVPQAINEARDRFARSQGSVPAGRSEKFSLRLHTGDMEETGLWKGFMVGDGMKLPWTPGTPRKRRREDVLGETE